VAEQCSNSKMLVLQAGANVALNAVSTTTPGTPYGTEVTTVTISATGGSGAGITICDNVLTFDGTTVAFTLPSNIIAGMGTDHIDVFVAGLNLIEGTSAQVSSGAADYSVSGSIITFGTAYPAGTSNSIRYPYTK